MLNNFGRKRGQADHGQTSNQWCMRVCETMERINYVWERLLIDRSLRKELTRKICSLTHQEQRLDQRKETF